jgi:hypothetical protein
VRRETPRTPGNAGAPSHGKAHRPVRDPHRD